MKQNPEFLDPPLTLNNLDRYIIRTSILQAFQETLPQLQGTLLDVGCGQMPYKPLLLSSESNVEKYIGLDLEGGRHSQRNPPDLLWDGKTIPLESETIDSAIGKTVSS